MEDLINDQIWAILDPRTNKRISCVLLSIEKRESGEVFWVKTSEPTLGRIVYFFVEEIFTDEFGENNPAKVI